MREGRKNPLCAQCTLCELIFVQAIDLAELCYNSRPHHLSQAAALHWSDITCWPRKKQETRLRFRPKARITPWGFLLLDDYQSLALSVQLGARLWGFPG